MIPLIWLAALLLLPAISVRAEEADRSNTWTGRKHLPSGLQRLRSDLSSQDPAVRGPAAVFLWGEPVGSPMQTRITFWQLDEDPLEEAIIETGIAGATIFLIFDRDSRGWWYVGRQVEDNHYMTAGFRVANWPGPQDRLHLVTFGAFGRGTGISIVGITVFRLEQGRLLELLSEEAHGHMFIWGDPGERTRYLQSFFSIEPNRLLLAKRYLTTKAMPKLSDYSAAREVDCFSLDWDPAAAVWRKPGKIPKAKCANVWTPLK